MRLISKATRAQSPSLKRQKAPSAEGIFIADLPGITVRGWYASRRAGGLWGWAGLLDYVENISVEETGRWHHQPPSFRMWLPVVLWVCSAAHLLVNPVSPW